ncbi:hypothetical protein AGLY_003275 [Aphis glycines]|uniref:Uncharacterized protein n=1 Tax=Aphis glycines TaxID=307491 RepID=A0A6G0U026_APHGL|nr:hypothetical protein AGLY_003275 [Aphis glycines]
MGRTKSATKLHIAKDAVINPENRPILEARVMSLDQLVTTFNSEQQVILSTLAEIDEVGQFMEVDENVTETMQSISQSSVQSLILPRIEIPKFDGNIIEWCSFRPPLIIVKAVPHTADNYSIAWNALKNQYDNKRLLVTAHLEKLFTFAPLTKESPASLSLFVNIFQENVSAIQALGVEDLAGFILFYIGSRVINITTRQLFEATVAKNVIPDLNSLLEFTLGKTTTKKTQGKKSEKTSLAAVTPTQSKKCWFCGYPHAIYRCFGFRNLAITSRRDFVNKNQLCFVCLNSGHMSNACPSSYTCCTCSSKHNTLLHVTDDTTKSSNDKTKDNSERTTTNCNATQFSGVTHTETTVLLGTVVVRVRDNTGALQKVKAALDSGSQVSAMTVDCVHRLGLSRRKCPVEVIGLSQQPVTTVKGQTNLIFFPIQADAPEFKATNVIVLTRIMSTMPNRVFPAEVQDRYRHLVFADPQFDRPAPVDMLIGGDLNEIILNHKLGYIIKNGRFLSLKETHDSICNQNHDITYDSDTTQLVM